MADGRRKAGPFLALFGLFAVTAYAFWQGLPGQPTPVPPAPTPTATVEPRADGPPLPLVLRMPDFAATEARPNGSVTSMGQGDPGTRIALIQNGVAVVEQPTAADGRFVVDLPAMNRPGTFEYRLRATAPDGRAQTSEELLTVVVPRTTAEAFTAIVSGPAGTRELARVDPTPLVVPRFQQVQIQPNGVASIGGQVDPNARVALLGNGRELGTATATPQGAFTIGPTQPLPAGVTRLELRSTHPDGRGVTSLERVIVDIPTVPGGAFAATLEAPGQVPRVLAQTPAANPRLPRFEVVDARADGTFTVTGTLEPNARVSLLANAQPTGQPVASGANGVWTVAPVTPAPPGTTEYRLRSVLGDGRTATSEERLIVQRPRDGGEAFEVRVETPGQAARIVARVEPQPIAAPRLGAITIEGASNLIATGTGAPGGRVELREGDRALSTATIGADGAFRLAWEVPAAMARGMLSLFSAVPDGRTSVGEERLAIERGAAGALRVGIADAAGAITRLLAERLPSTAEIIALMPAPPLPPPLIVEAPRPTSPAPAPTPPVVVTAPPAPAPAPPPLVVTAPPAPPPPPPLPVVPPPAPAPIVQAPAPPPPIVQAPPTTPAVPAPAMQPRDAAPVPAAAPPPRASVPPAPRRAMPESSWK